jgi:hypothetical protein
MRVEIRSDHCISFIQNHKDNINSQIDPSKSEFVNRIKVITKEEKLTYKIHTYVHWTLWRCLRS